jgi:hypothetical protein
LADKQHGKLICKSPPFHRYAQKNFNYKENGYLLMVDGREVDAIGVAQDKWVKLTQNCSRVRSVDAQTPELLTLLQLIRGYSPPASESAQVI